MEQKPTWPAVNRKVKYVESYDFKQPKLFSKEIMRTLRFIHDTLSRNLSRVISSTIRYKVDVNLQDIVQLSTHEFIQSVFSPSAIYMLKSAQIEGDLVVVLPTEFCIHMIERQSGGPGKEISAPRVLTLIEEKIVNRVMKNITKEIINAWEPVTDFDLDITGYESKPENLHITSVDPTILARINVEIEGAHQEIFVSYSYGFLKKAMNHILMDTGMKSRVEPLGEQEFEGYIRTIKKTNAWLQPLLGTTKVTLDDLLNLKEGDIIPLKQKCDEPLSVLVNGVKKMSAYPGTLQGHRAVKIFEVIEEINEEELV